MRCQLYVLLKHLQQRLDMCGEPDRVSVQRDSGADRFLAVDRGPRHHRGLEALPEPHHPRDTQREARWRAHSQTVRGAE